MPSTSAAPAPAQTPAPTSLATSLVTGRALVLLQLLTRLLTFGLNQALVRLAPPEVFGTAAIQFDLVCSTVLFLSREGVRNALLRAKSGPTEANGPDSDQNSVQKEDKHATGKASEDQIAALASVPFYLGVLVSAVVVTIYLYTLPRSTSQQPDFLLSLLLYVSSSLVELAIEPLYIRALRSDPPNIRARVQAEGGMAIVKAVITVASVVFFERAGRGRPLLAFAVGQMAGAVWLAGRYVFEYGTKGLLRIKKGQRENLFDPQLLALAMANTRQSVVKHLLTEADRIAVGRICPLDEQGGYAVAMNYGSLVARIIFQPLEETLLLHFSRDLSSASTSSILYMAIHFSSHLLLLLPAFIPPLLPAVLPILLPRRYRNTSAPRTLEVYLKAYIPLLSLNGILEAFHASSASPKQVARQARWMIASSAAFVLALWSMIEWSDIPAIGIHLGKEEALIYASCVTTLVRITYAYWHARRFFTRLLPSQGGEDIAVFSAKLRSVRQLLPRWQVWVAVLGSGAGLRWVQNAVAWQSSWKQWALLVGTGGMLGMINLGIIAFVERRDSDTMLARVRQGVKAKQG